MGKFAELFCLILKLFVISTTLIHVSAQIQNGSRSPGNVRMRTDGTRGLRRLGTDIGATRGGQRMMGGALSNRMRNTVPGMRQIPLSRRQDVIRQRLRNGVRGQGQRTGRFDPRTGSLVQIMPESQIRTRVAVTSSRRNQTPPLFAMCRRPRTVRCFRWPTGQDPVNAYRCDGACPREECIVPCQCSCVDPRIIDRLRRFGRISGRELRPVDPRLWQSFDPLRTRNRSPTIPRSNRLPLPRRDALPMARNRSSSAINFGISDDVLATLIAQPDLNILVGPQGINQIIAGEPPVILPSETIIPTTAEIRQQPPPVNTTTTTSQEVLRRSAPSPNQNMGIPVPMNRINLVPLQDTGPQGAVAAPVGATSGLNIDLPQASPVVVPAPTVERSVTVEKIPGTRALFIDLTLKNPNTAPVRGRSRSTQRRLGSGNGSVDRTFTRPLNSAPLDPIMAENSSSVGVLSGAGPSSSSREALPLTQGPLQKIMAGTSQGRAPTKDECLSRQRELWCDPVGPWDVTPGVARWCLLNCRSDNCDNTRCSCQCIDETLFRFRYEQISLRAP